MPRAPDARAAKRDPAPRCKNPEIGGFDPSRLLPPRGETSPCEGKHSSFSTHEFPPREFLPQECFLRANAQTSGACRGSPAQAQGWLDVPNSPSELRGRGGGTSAGVARLAASGDSDVRSRPARRDFQTTKCERLRHRQNNNDRFLVLSERGTKICRRQQLSRWCLHA